MPSFSMVLEQCMLRMQVEFPAFWDQTLSSDAVHFVTVVSETEEWHDLELQTQDCMRDKVC